jgi:hypothetical protein
VRWSARITANARGKSRNTTAKRNNDEGSLTTHTLYLPDEPRHTVHEVALERAPPETVIEAVRELARANAKDALEVLIAVMKNEEATESTRVTAAIAVLDRGCGKPAPAADDDAPDPVRLETIRQIIVDPGHPDRESIPAVGGAGPV